MAATGAGRRRESGCGSPTARRSPFDRVLIATGTRARPWPNPTEAQARRRLRAPQPRRRRTAARAPGRAARTRVLVIGGGFTGSEIASACRELGLRRHRRRARRRARSVGALGGVDRRTSRPTCSARTASICAAASRSPAGGRRPGRFRRAHLSDGSRVDADVAVVALGGDPQHRVAARLRPGRRPVRRRLRRGLPRLRHQRHRHRRHLRRRRRRALPAPALSATSSSPWSTGATPSSRPQIAAHNMICAPSRAPAAPRHPRVLVEPVRRQHQVGRRPVAADEVDDHPGLARVAAASSPSTATDGRIVAAVTFNQGRWLEYYRAPDRAGRAVPARAAGAADRRRGERADPVGLRRIRPTSRRGDGDLDRLRRERATRANGSKWPATKRRASAHQPT